MKTRFQSRAIPSIQHVLPTFQKLFPAETVRALAKASGKRFYERLFTPLLTVWCLMFQRLNADHTLDAAVAHVGSGAVDHLEDRHEEPVSARIVSESTAAYSRSRKRLPLSILAGVVQHLAQAAEQCLEDGARWHSHPVALLDGTTLLARPEPELVDRFGQAQNQYGAAYWVVIRVVAAFCLHTASLLSVADGSQRESEQALVKPVLAQLVPNTVCVGDQGFGVFSVAQAARNFGVLILFRLTLSRAQALAKRDNPSVARLRSGEDRSVQWAPSLADQADSTMSMTPISGRLIYKRIERDGFRPIDLYLFTTLLDQSNYSVDDLLALYGHRWHVELDLRYVKSTLDLDFLTSKTVEMVRKELWAGLAAYNLVRAYMAMAAKKANLTPLSLSFAKCWRRTQQALFQMSPTDTPERAAERLRRLLSRLGRCRLQKRELFRIEPRAVHRRPAVYPALKGSRKKARQVALLLLQITTTEAKS
jgi:hypothetical protein